MTDLNLDELQADMERQIGRNRAMSADPLVSLKADYLRELIRVSRERNEWLDRAHSEFNVHLSTQEQLIAAQAERDELRAENDHLRGFCYKAAQAKGDFSFVCAEAVAAQARIAELEAGLREHACNCEKYCARAAFSEFPREECGRYRAAALLKETPNV